MMKVRDLIFKYGAGQGGGAPNPNAYADKLVSLFNGNIIRYLPLWESSGAYADDYGPNNMDALYNGVELGQTGIGDGRTSVLVGTGDYINLYSTAFRDAFNGAEGTLILWAKVLDAGVWTDGASHVLCKISGGTNQVLIQKNANNRIEFIYTAAAQKQYRLEGVLDTDWMCLAVAWSLSNDRVRFYKDGAQVGGTFAGIGAWAGTLSEANNVLGAANTSADYPWSGYMAHAILLNREATPAEVANAAALPFDFETSTPYGSSLRTFQVASGGDINATCSLMRAGDTLELEAGGTYTMEFGVGAGGHFNNLPSGWGSYKTTVHGNGATVSGGESTIILSGKNGLSFSNLNVGPGGYWALHAKNSNSVDFTDCNFYNPATGGNYDTVRIESVTYYEFTRCEFTSTIDFDGPRAHDGFEIWGPAAHVTLTDCKAYNVKSGVTQNEGHGFEVYGQLAGEVVDDVKFINCEAYNCQVGFSVEGGPLSLSHTNVVCDGCSSHDNAFYGYQGIDGSTLYRQNGCTAANNGVSDTNGAVTDLP
jgi:hypothetical protein